MRAGHVDLARAGAEERADVRRGEIRRDAEAAEAHVVALDGDGAVPRDVARIHDPQQAAWIHRDRTGTERSARLRDAGDDARRGVDVAAVDDERAEGVGRAGEVERAVVVLAQRATLHEAEEAGVGEVVKERIHRVVIRPEGDRALRDDAAANRERNRAARAAVGEGEVVDTLAAARTGHVNARLAIDVNRATEEGHGVGSTDLDGAEGVADGTSQADAVRVTVARTGEDDVLSIDHACGGGARVAQRALQEETSAVHRDRAGDAVVRRERDDVGVALVGEDGERGGGDVGIDGRIKRHALIDEGLGRGADGSRSDGHRQEAGAASGEGLRAINGDGRALVQNQTAAGQDQ